MGERTGGVAMKMEQFIEEGGIPKDAGFNFSINRTSEILIAMAHRIIAIEVRLERLEKDET